MFRLCRVLCLFLFFWKCVLQAKSIPCRGTAIYRLQFQAEWKNTTSRPPGALFSGLIGCSHNKCYQMWKPGEKASLGVKNVAEKGKYTELYHEIQKHIEKWDTALQVLETKNNTISAEEQVILPEINAKSGFTVDSSRPLVSIIAKIFPFPDWFIGVHDINLCNKSGNWIPEEKQTLFPYDAGTADRSVDNSSIVKPTSPRKNIILKEEPDIGDSARGLGFMRFILIEKFETPSEVVIDEDNCPNIASLRKVSFSLVLCAMIATIILTHTYSWQHAI